MGKKLQGRLKFNHHTAAELNFSQYVQLAYDSNQQCFAIIAATKDSDNAVQFYNRGGDAKPYPISLYTKAAIETIANMMNWHDENKYYSIPGQRFVEEGASRYHIYYLSRRQRAVQARWGNHNNYKVQAYDVPHPFPPK